MYEIGKIKDITNQRFGKFIALKYKYCKKGEGAMWECICDCGKTAIVSGHNLRLGRIKSCGCLKHETAPHTIHNLSNTKIYNAYCAMIQRCYNENNKNYKDYGGRGIKICDEWLQDFMNFYNWAINNGKLTIDRVDNNRGYEPNNCRWVTMKVQSMNRRNNLKFKYKGKERTVKELANIAGITEKQFRHRLERGWSIFRIINTPINASKRK